MGLTGLKEEKDKYTEESGMSLIADVTEVAIVVEEDKASEAVNVDEVD